jgi:hypothetical protein
MLNQRYAVVKHAGAGWELYFTINPNLGAHPSFSSHDTHTGKCVGLQSGYEDICSAQIDCDTINKINPPGNYAVCPITEPTTGENNG